GLEAMSSSVGSIPGARARSARRRGFVPAAVALSTGGLEAPTGAALPNSACAPDALSPQAPDLSHLLRGERPATWVFTGDSITHGALFTEGWRSFVEHFAERVRWELRRFDDVVINTGVCGEHTGGLLENLERRALRFGPDVVFVLLGMNDSLAGPA